MFLDLGNLGKVDWETQATNVEGWHHLAAAKTHIDDLPKEKVIIVRGEVDKCHCKQRE